MEQSYKKLRAYLDAHKGEMFALWKRIVDMESGTGDKPGVDAVGAVLADEMERAGIAVERVPMAVAGDFLIGRWNWGAKAAPVLFIGHMDTVLSGEAGRGRRFRIDPDGRARGLGCLDMKGGLVMGVYIVKALAAAGCRGRPVKLLYVGDEENQHRHSNGVEILRAQAAGAAAAFNFETGDPDDRFLIGRKGGGVVTVEIHGVSAHSGIAPQAGRSAILEAADKVKRLEALNDIPRGKLLNVGTISGGSGENVIPDYCRFNLGVRFPNQAVKEEILSDIRRVAAEAAVPGTRAEVTVRTLMDSMETTPGIRALFEKLRGTAARCGYGEIIPAVSDGVSDSGAVVSAGVPAVCGMGPRGAGSHSPEEYAEADSLIERAWLAACAVCDLGGEPANENSASNTVRQLYRKDTTTGV